MSVAIVNAAPAKKKQTKAKVEKVDSIALMIDKANKGDAKAQNTVGVWYYTGKDTLKQDYKKALQYWALSAKQDNVDAIGNMAMCYQLGRGTKKDSTMAVNLYKAALKKGSKTIIPQHETIVKNTGSLFSSLLLKECYKDGIGTKKDIQKYVYYMEQAANKQDVTSQYELALYYLNNQQADKAVTWFKKAAKLGEVGATYYYGYLMFNGQGMVQDKKGGIKLLQSAADKDFTMAYYQLGRIYYEGDGTDQDYKKAVEYLRKAADSKNYKAKWLLGLCYLNGNGVNDEIPYLPGYDTYHTTFRPYFLGFAGDHYLDEEGNVMPWYMHPDAYKMLEKGHEWYEKGYIYPEYLTTGYDQIVDLAAADRIAVFSGWYNDTVRPSNTVRENNPDSTVSWAAMNNLQDAPAASFWPSNPKYRAVLAMTAAGKEPEAAIRLLDWMVADDDNYMLMTYGIEGEHWEYKGENEYVRMPDADDRYLAEYQVLDWYDPTRFAQQYIEPEDWVQLELKKLRDQINAGDCQPPFDYYVPYSLAGTEADMLTSDAETLISETVTKVIYGQAGEDEWNEDVKTAWETDGQIRSKVWTEQYAPFAR